MRMHKKRVKKSKRERIDWVKGAHQTPQWTTKGVEVI